MLSEKDYAVVSQMCRTGMSLEVLKKSFPQFNADDIEAVYIDYLNEEDDENTVSNTISCNCS